MRISVLTTRLAAAAVVGLVAAMIPASPTRAATWSWVATPNPSQWDNRFNGVAESGGVAFAVGSTATAGTRPLVARWNGSAWSTVTTPALSTDSALHGVDLAGTAAGWAVGEVGSSPLIERWNGSSWTLASAATPSGATNSALRGVKAFGANDAWAVGHWSGSGTGVRTLIERWNGTSWTVTPSPSPDSIQNFVVAVDGTSSGNLWAIGNMGHDGYGGGTTAGFVLRWSGSAWSRVTVPGADSTFSIIQLRDIVATSTDVWIVGTAFHRSLFSFVPYVLRWNGQSWQHGTIPAAPAGGFQGVTALSATNVYAVGGKQTGQPLVARFNGSGWSQETVSSPAGSTTLMDATATAPSTISAVGTQYTSSGTFRTVAVRTTNG